MDLLGPNQLDFLIRHSLSDLVRRAEPSPDLWQRIRGRIEAAGSEARSVAECRAARVRQAHPWLRPGLIASVMEVEPLCFYVLRWMPEKAVYNFHSVI